MKALISLALIMTINLFFFFGQVANDNIANSFGEEHGQTIFDLNNSMLSQFQDGDSYELVDPSIPETEQGIDPESDNNIFTDIWNSLKGAITKGTGSIHFLWQIINAVPAFLKVIGLPMVFVWGLGALWHAYTLVMIVLLLAGRLQ